MSVFVDTSAVLAVLDADDRFHPQARRLWKELLEREEDVFCTNYVAVESFALIQNRLGVEAVRRLAEEILPAIRIHWVAPEEHHAAVGALLTSGRRNLSLVDCVSFETMRRSGVSDAFAFDHDFQERGFRLLQ